MVAWPKMEVEIVESCMVPPGEATPNHRLWLSVFDLVLGRMYSPVIYLFRRPCPGSAAFFSPDVLKAALSKALVPYYPMAGRLGTTDTSGRAEIHCTGDGVLFVTARTDATLDLDDDKLETPVVPSEELRRQTTMLVPSEAEAAAAAGVLAMFQVTFFKCGGVCLGTAIHHTVCDGRAGGDFMQMWAAIARVDGDGHSDTTTTTSASSLQPCLDRTLLRGRSPPAVRFQHPEYPQHGSGAPSKTTNVPFDTAVFPISKNQVDALKRAAAGASAIAGGKKKVSTYSAVVAHVWQCSCKAKRLSGTANSQIYGVGCLRSRLCPPLPRVFFGNAIAMTSTTVTTVKDIVSSPLDSVADKVTAAAAALSDEYIRSLADHLELAMNEAPMGVYQPPWLVTENDLLVVSWIGLSITAVDFGWGRPSFVGRAVHSKSNLLYLVPSPDGDGRLNVVLTMEPQALARFRELFYEGISHYSLPSEVDGAQEQDACVAKHTEV